MATNLIDTKSLLAKLMAQENITVVHSNKVSTASFDLRQRTLVCPIWKDMGGDLYDLCMGHEVSHALNTPTIGWHTALGVTVDDIKNNRKIEVDEGFKYILNVLEDARIEKKIKRKFPGLRQSFNKAYQDLYYVRDFFGVKKLGSTKKLNIIDRINIYSKVGFSVPIKFNDKERKLIKRVEALETWDEVVTLANDLRQYARKHEQEKINSLDDLKKAIEDAKNNPQQGDGEESEQESSSCNEGAESDVEEGEDGTGSGDESKDGDSDEEVKDGKASGGEPDKDGESDKGDEDLKNVTVDAEVGGISTGKDQREIVSVTDKIFRANEDTLVDKNAKAYINATFPKLNSDNFIIKPEQMVKTFEDNLHHAQYNRTQTTNAFDAKASYDKISNECYAWFLNKNKNYVNLLAKEFEMRKNAQQYTRSQTHRTGELDTRVLANYKFNNDIFRRMTEVPKGKNHGMILILDMSGSMAGDYMFNSIDQILTLVAFCEKVGIPYDVYGFSDTSASSFNRKEQKYEGMSDIRISTSYNFHMRHMLSSRSTLSIHNRCSRMLAYYAAHEADNSPVKQLLCGKSFNHHGLELGGTPLIEAIMVSRDIIDKFQKDTRSDIVNVIHLTDGAGSVGHISIPNATYGTDAKIVLTDPITKKRMIIEDKSMLQEKMTEFVAQVTGCRHIGFYICSKKEIANQCAGRKIKDTDHIHRGFLIVPQLGFDSYYYVADEILAYQEKITQSDDPTKIQANFVKNQTAKKYAKMVLSEFAKSIAVRM